MARRTEDAVAGTAADVEAVSAATLRKVAADATSPLLGLLSLDAMTDASTVAAIATPASEINTLLR